nr:uncharacterized protein LOC123759968 [Procambarus clarkii]XP_045601185.1 uncharacterized protein LOC123759968 [Procambarus clarkii]
MSNAAPRSCLKPPLRNPWVAEDGADSSTSSGQQQQQQQATHDAHAHDVLAHQYATPYHPTTSHTAAHPSLSVAHSTHSVALSSHSAAHPTHSVAHATHSVAHPTYSMAHATYGAAHPTLSAAHPGHCISAAHPAVSVAWAAHGVGQHTHTTHGVVHSHTAHSLHSTAHALPTAAHSVHSVPGTLQQPWVDPQMLWSTPALPGMGSAPGGVFTVGGGAEGSCPVLAAGMCAQPHPTLHPMHHLPPGGGGSSGQTSTSGGWGVPPPTLPPQAGGVGGWGVGGRALAEGSRCERCHYYCFRAAQAAFVAGIVTGFSLLVAGGVFHRQHVAHLQVLVYIGAMVSLVCVVLLVIFCAMNRDHRTRRGVSVRYSGPQVVVGDPETMPLRGIDVTNPIVIPCDHGPRPGDGGPSVELLHQTNHSSCMVPPPATHGGCIVGPTNQSVCFVPQANHNAGSVKGSSANHGGVAASEASHHISQARHAPQKVDEDCEASQRYNLLWKQSSKASSETASKL